MFQVRLWHPTRRRRIPVRATADKGRARRHDDETAASTVPERNRPRNRDARSLFRFTLARDDLGSTVGQSAPVTPMR
jgi:hypothetical protein